MRETNMETHLQHCGKCSDRIEAKCDLVDEFFEMSTSGILLCV